ncbi:aminotransferase class IV [uncultured Pontibacter sp.]|uniref:aminotransferase class IV n=1 Tax=uncultured Pontibacter sp. TaxID=453356 RepID=UPI00261306F1|nr:aminotransferase class IV [uncultured Pontibacter sp.]
MFILYNNQLIPEQYLCIPISDRAFQYNDGFFETAIVVNGVIRFWPEHLQRMREAATVLDLQLPDYFFQTAFKEQLLLLAQQENAINYARLKLKVWRSGEGLYTPQTNQVYWYATLQQAAPAPQAALHIGICQNVNTVCTPLSHFKGPNAQLYVLAGLEKKAHQHDDMLLLTQQGMIGELISSNIFWLKDNVLFTPGLTSGCVNGILRRNIIKWCTSQQIKVQEVLQNLDQLQHADAVFSANVTGIRGLASLNGTPLNQQNDFLKMLRSALQL